MSKFYTPIDWGSVSPPFVGTLYGKESFFKEEEVRRAKKTFSGRDVLEIEVDESKETLERIRGELSSENIFLDTEKLIILREIGKIDNSSVIENYCKNPSSSKIVLLLSKNQSRVQKWIRNLQDHVSKQCKSIKSYKLSDWIQEYAKRREYKIQKRYAEVIVDNVGENLFALSNELEKIFVCHEGEGKIQEEDLQAALFQHSEMGQFDIVEAWANRNEKKTFRLLSIHYEKNSRDPTLKILAAFLHHVENLIYILSAKKFSRSRSEIQDYIGKPSFIMKKLYKQASNWNLSEMKKSYNKLCEIDAKIKTGSDGRVLLENFIASKFTEEE